MKTLARALPLLLALASGVGCSDTGSGQEPAGQGVVAASPDDPSAAPAPTGPARIVFEETVLDFGEVWDTDELKGRFPFTNTGGKALNITDVKPSCGCTTTELSRTRFEPGEGDALELVWKPKGHGTQAKTITVRSTSEGPGIDMLTIKAVIKPFASFTPSPLMLGELALGEEHRRRVHLTCVDPEFELLNLRTAHRSVAANVVGTREDGAKEIELVIPWDAPWGLLTLSVQATVRGVVPGKEEPIEHVATLQVHGSLFGDLRMTPTMFGVGQVLPGKSFEKSVLLNHLGGEPFEVVSATVRASQPPGMTVRAEPRSAEEGGGYNLIVSGESKDYVGLIRGQVLVDTDVPGEGQRTLPIYGIVRE